MTDVIMNEATVIPLTNIHNKHDIFYSPCKQFHIHLRIQDTRSACEIFSLKSQSELELAVNKKTAHSSQTYNHKANNITP